MEPCPRNPRYEHLVFTSITLLWDFENFSAIGVKFWIWEAIQIHSQMWEMLLGKRRGRGGVWSTTTLPLPDGEYDNQYVHYSETWRLLHLNEGLETVCGSTPLGARIEHCLAQWTVCLVFLHHNCPRIIFQDQQERWQDNIIFNGYLVLPLPPPPFPPVYSDRQRLLFLVFYVYEWYILSCFVFSPKILILRLVTALLALLRFLEESF